MCIPLKTPKQHKSQPNMIKQAPMLFLLRQHETKHGFFDLDEETLNIYEIPQLNTQLHCLSSGYGWLLLLSRQNTSLFFFNPFTTQRIDILYRSVVFSAATFSAAPTSPDCVLYTIEKDCVNGNLHINTLLVGQERVWTQYMNVVSWKQIGGVIKTLVCNGVLYLVDSFGRVSSFERRVNRWTNLSHNELNHVRFSNLFEIEGVIYGVKIRNHEEIVNVYRLKFEDGMAKCWEEVEELDGVTLFVCPTNTFGVSGLAQELNNKVVVANENCESKCVIYNFGEDGCETIKKLSIREFRWGYTPIWI